MRPFIGMLIAAFALAGVANAKVGDDGLHKQPWFSITFKDVAEDIAAAKADGKRLAIIIEQRGCIYCKKLHETVFSDAKIAKYIADNFVVVQYNMFGDEEVIDTDGATLTEKTAVRKWGLAFTPTILFLPEAAPQGKTAKQAAVMIMPGAFGRYTTLHMFQWVREKGYLKDEPFQKYHARKLSEAKGTAK
ncbi:MAG: thioredoxin family protein [Hyphomicrobiaceae bacterium]